MLKAGSRALVNTSPEPVSNVAASAAEDVAVVGALALVFSYPWIALGVAVLTSVLIAALVWWVWRALSRLSRKPANSL